MKIRFDPTRFNPLTAVKTRFSRMRQRLTRTPRPCAERPTDLDPIEGSVQSALQPVETPRGFRETLRENLAYAAQRQQSGVSVEYPRPVRELVWLTLSLGAVVATVTTVLLVKRGQPRPES